MSGPRPKLLVFPGIDGHVEMRQGLAAFLSSRLEVQTVALPDDPGLDYASMAQEIAERLPEGALVLAGESFSGPLVALIAEKCPDKVVGVAFIASFPTLAFPRAAARLLDYVPLRAVPFGLIAWALMGGGGAGDVSGQLRTALRLLPEQAAKRRAKLALGVDVRETIRRLPQPVLVVHGKRDRLLPGDQVSGFLNLRPDAQVAVIVGYHMILETHPEQVAWALAMFIDSLPSRGALHS